MPKLFSGKNSKPFWAAISRVKGPDHRVLYDAGCDAQNLEAEVERTRREFKSIVEQHAEVERLRDAARDVLRLLELGDQQERLLASDGPCGGQKRGDDRRLQAETNGTA